MDCRADQLVFWTGGDDAASSVEVYDENGRVTGVYRNGRVFEVLEETDPYGIEAGIPGAKLDAGKAPITQGCLHYFPRALAAVAELSAVGAKKYSWKGWESVPDGINRYANALGRHETRIEGNYSRRDPDSGVLEVTAVAWNALARLELVLRGAA